MSPSHPGHRQWHPRSECTRGRAFPGSVEAAFSSIRLAGSALGLKPAVYATVLPSKQSTGGERHALPVPGLDLADVRGPFLVRTLGREVPVDEIGGSRRRLALVGTIPASLGHVRHEPFLRHDPADRLLRYAGLEHRLDPAVPVPALGIGERPGHLRPESGVLVNAQPGVVAVGGRSARCRASMSSSRANTPASTGRSTGSSPCSTGAAGRRRGLFYDLRHLPHQRVLQLQFLDLAAQSLRHHHRLRTAGDGSQRAYCPARRSCFWAATRPCRPCGTP